MAFYWVDTSVPWSIWPSFCALPGEIPPTSWLLHHVLFAHPDCCTTPCLPTLAAALQVTWAHQQLPLYMCGLSWPHPSLSSCFHKVCGLLVAPLSPLSFSDERNTTILCSAAERICPGADRLGDHQQCCNKHQSDIHHFRLTAETVWPDGARIYGHASEAPVLLSQKGTEVWFKS